MQKVTFTTKIEEVGLALFPVSVKERVRELFSHSKSGTVTITVALPRQRGTDEQNRAFHALIGELYISGLHSFAGYEDMRDTFKLRSAGAKEYIFLSDGRQHTCKSLESIPAGSAYISVPKSWSEFTRDERTTAIEMVIAYGYEVGINSKKWDEILDGMQHFG